MKIETKADERAAASTELAPLLNRARDGGFRLPEDGFYQLAPKGEFFQQEQKVYQVIDDQALQMMVNRFGEEAQRQNFGGLLVDYDHFSYDADKSSEAAGWILELQNRDSGLWAKIKWSPEGEAKVKNGNYRFASPVWKLRDCEQLGNSRVRPQRLDTAGLTNSPNLKGMVPLSNRTPLGGTADNEAPGEAQRRDAAATNNERIEMKKTTELLGLSADATDEVIAAEVTKLKNRNTELETANRGLQEAQVESDLAKYANRFKPEAKGKWKEALMTNRASALELLESMPTPAEAKQPEKAPVLHNRAGAATPGQGQGAGTDAQQQAREQAAKVEEYRLANRCSYGDARNAVRAKHPELFGLKS